MTERGRPERGDVPPLDPSVVMPSLGDLDPATFRAAAHAVADLMADYLERVERYPVLPAVAPGSLRARFAHAAPEDAEPIGALLDDYARDVEPLTTHWQHPGFLAYFATTASAPGVLGEMLTAVLGANAMLWRTSPVATELEEVVVGWLRDALGLPVAFDGLFTDTASTSSLSALAAARELVGDVAAEGLAGRRLRIYASTEAHSSIDKAAMTLGIGRAGLRRVAVDASRAMDPDALRVAVAEDRADGWIPCAIVASVGTTGTTAVDPVEAIADVAEEGGLWLHVDAAYAGAVALLPERRGPFAGWERADSIVINPHKWLFAPLDCSLLLSRRPELLRRAFSVVPAYLAGEAKPVHDYHEYTPQLGRRFRALKMWFLLRAFGLEGLRRRIREHLALAQEFAAWVDAEPDAERVAPVPFSTVCLRWVPAHLRGYHPPDADIPGHLDALNAELLARLDRSGEVLLSQTRVDGRLVLRVAIGNLRTERRHVARAWELIQEHGRALAGEHDQA